MADGTAIEWTDATWNIITGCSVVSPGCTNCYAMKLAGTRLAHHPSRAGLTRDSNAGPVWTGGVRFNEQWINDPWRWKRPRRIFVCAHGDLFHEAVPDGWIARVWNVMGQCDHHQFQILTKRPARMREWVTRWADLSGEDGDPKLVRGPDATRAAHPSGRGQLFAAMLYAMGSPPPGAAYPTFDWMAGQMWWPPVLPNVWLGVSVEDQVRADERIPDLLGAPAAVRFLSCEPLLGPINLHSALCRKTGSCPTCPQCLGGIDWLIAGGESGPGARPMHPGWPRGLRDQCVAAGVPFFFKQWGNWAPVCAMAEAEIDACYHAAPDRHPDATRRCKVSTCVLHSDGQRFDRPANDGAYAQGSGATMMMEIGKKAAGSLLDGREHKAFPDG
jgi:protein gp37